MKHLSLQDRKSPHLLFTFWALVKQILLFDKFLPPFTHQQVSLNRIAGMNALASLDKKFSAQFTSEKESIDFTENASNVFGMFLECLYIAPEETIEAIESLRDKVSELDKNKKLKQ